MNQCIVAFVLVISVCAGHLDVSAHVPHDDVGDIELSPDFSHDQTVYATVRGVLFKSTDGGYEWHRLFRGLGTCAGWLIELALAPDFPSDPTMFVTCHVGGMYRSNDAGQSWEEIGDGLGDHVIDQLVISPTFGIDQKVLAVTSEGSLYYTLDAGETWERLLDDHIISAIDWGGDWIVCGTPSGELYGSEDGGSTWSQLGRIPGNPRITTIEVDRSSLTLPGLLVGTEGDGSVWSAKFGETFELIRRDTLGSTVTALASLLEEGSHSFLASTWDEAVFRSEDGGASWHKYGSRLMKSRQADEINFPHFSTIAIADDHVTVFLATFCGLFRSDDGGRSWYRLEVTLHHIVGLDVARMGDNRNSVVIGTYGVGAYSTDETGLSWKVHNRGLPSPRLGAIAYSPQYAEDNTLFAASYSNVLRSTDGGESWSQAVLRGPDPPVERLKTAIRRVVSQSSVLRQKSWFEALKRGNEDFSEALVFAISPAFSEDQTVFVGVHPGGIWRSIDGGSSFSLLWDVDSDVRSLAISPNFSDDGVLIAALRDGRLFHSQDGGSNWKHIGKELPLGGAGQSNVAISPDFGRDQTVYAGGMGGLFRTRDGGDTWVKIRGGELGNDGPVTGLAISPNYAEDRQLLVQVRGGHLWVCHDGTDNFEATRSTAADDGYGFFQLIYRESAPLIKFSPNYREDQTVYAASVYHLVKSIDGGRTWETIPRPAIRLDTESTLWHWYFIPIYLTGDWTNESNAEHNSSGALYATGPESKLTLSFIGTGVIWIGTRGPDRGKARVYVDGQRYGTVDQFSQELVYATSLFSATELPYGPHTLTIEVADTHNPESAGYRVDSDAFEVIQRSGTAYMR